MKALQSALSLVLVALVSWPSSASATEEPRQLYRVTGPRALFEAFYSENAVEVDLWATTSHDDGTIDADVYGPPSVVVRHVQALGARMLRDDQLRFLAQAADTSAAAVREQLDIQVCHAETAGYMDAVGANDAPFTASTFHDCWRNSSQVFAYLDKLTALSSGLMTKTDSIGRTFQGQAIPVYTISTGTLGVAKQALVAQALIHSREWQTGGSVFYIMAGMLDALLRGDARVHAIFDLYDWHFVPILNIDGYDHTWTPGNRFWRKNRRTFSVGGRPYVGVDLNRNFGPNEFFDLTGDSKRPNTDIYPGTGVLSEPESAAVFAFLRTLEPTLAGLLDVHMNGQALLRPYSNQVDEAPEPYKTKLTALGEAMQLAIQNGTSLTYRNVMGGTGSYLAYGTFKDAVFMEMGNVPAYTFELERADGGFISPQSAIRDVGARTLAAFLAYSEGIAEYWREV